MDVEPMTEQAGRVRQRADWLDLPGALRALRRRADLSQRELADHSGVPPATVGSVESGGTADPRFRTVERMVAATGARLAIVDLDGSELTGRGANPPRDAARRQLPPHLDPHWVSWRGARRVDRYGFIRNRTFRDVLRREDSNERRQGLDYEVRRLGPGDASVLTALHAGARDLDLAGRVAPTALAPSDEAALRYLRDPDVRHWVGEERPIGDDRQRGRVLAQLVAHVHRRHTGPPLMVVTAIGMRADHRAGRLGIQLVAAMSDDAALLGVAEILALPDHPVVERYLRGLGFRRRPRRRSLLTLIG